MIRGKHKMKKTNFTAVFAGAVLAAVLAFGFTSCGGEKETPAKDFVTYEINGEILISGYKGKPQQIDIIIPKKIKGKPVTTISDGAFSGLKFVNSIKLHDGIKKIGTGAFAGCPLITSIAIPEGITEIGENTFNTCERLETITLPSTLKSIGTFAFKACKSLKKINIPEGVESIGDYAFIDCNSLCEITLPSTVKTAGDRAFFNTADLKISLYSDAWRCLARTNCKNLEVKVLGDYDTETFNNFGEIIERENMPNAESVFLDMSEMKGSAKIKHSAFFSYDDHSKYKSSLTKILLPDGITEIGDGAFCGSSIRYIKIPESVTKIDDKAFASSSLENIELPQTLTKISDSTFNRCKALKTIIIPESVKILEDFAFFKCSSLETIYYRGSKGQLKFGLQAVPSGVNIIYDYTGE